MVIDITKKELVSELTENVKVLLYKKQSGEEREVVATLIPNKVPTVSHPKIPSDTHVTVFDLDAMQWRTLIMNNIQKIIS
tara:strand:- start:3123 stop:3362 length:240 start_codon:yes stop_codon:yes gene_type:complete